MRKAEIDVQKVKLIKFFNRGKSRKMEQFLFEQVDLTKKCLINFQELVFMDNELVNLLQKISFYLFQKKQTALFHELSVISYKICYFHPFLKEKKIKSRNEHCLIFQSNF